jgi:Glycosyl hydrolase family 99
VPREPAAWTLADARAALHTTAGLAVTDESQPDEPRYVLSFPAAGDAKLEPLGAGSFAYAGSARDAVSGRELAVSFRLDAGPGGRFAISAFRGPDADTSQPGLPLRAAFYYPWFPELWSAEGLNPFTRYRPSLGLYDSADPAVIAEHVAAMRYGNVAAAISSWWGIGHVTDERFARLLAVARPTPFRFAVYYEPEGYGDPSVERLRDDLAYIARTYGSSPAYLRIDGRIAVFAYGDEGDGCAMAERWREANTLGAYVVLKVFPGFESCPAQPDGWHQYAPANAASVHRPYAATISPGFHGATGELRLPRDLDRWRHDVAGMTASGLPLQLISTFNEWGEGTAVESAEEWTSASGYGDYLDVLHEIA